MFESQKEPEDRTVGKSDKEYEPSVQRAALLFANSLKVLTDDSIKRVTDQMIIDVTALRSQLNQVLNEQQVTLGRMPAKLMQLETQLAQVHTSQQQIIYLLQRMEKQLDQFIAEGKLLENASQENRLLSREHYQDHVIQPMVRALFPLFDLLQDFRDSDNEGQRNSSRHSDDLADGALIQLRQFLSIYEVQPIQHEPGANFDPGQMRPVKTASTPNKQLDSRVAKSLRAGFRWRQDVVLRFESVVLYKYQEAEPTTDNGKGES